MDDNTYATRGDQGRKRTGVLSWVCLFSSVLLLLESALITFTNDESSGLIRVDLLLVFPIGALALFVVARSIVEIREKRRGGIRSLMVAAATFGILAICWFASHAIFLTTAHVADLLGFQPKDCSRDSSPGFNWGRYCKVK